MGDETLSSSHHNPIALMSPIISLTLLVVIAAGALAEPKAAAVNRQLAALSDKIQLG